ncbi:palmdelphin isoform X2 [Siniperca chuatsi]|uniref:palmdelphin isoform X2 n=1 Tax=Siniperca chuatsi TaxID=119488 RepID=UPI001CE1AF96|nr:palmdelphin isoform X2 [Siniperca chuatsi]
MREKWAVARMEESDLLKERLQAITEKHHIQEDIRQKKLELDQEKLKLQHLKKKALKEQWLLQDSASHNATDSPRQQSLLSDQQQTRALQLNIHRIEMEVESLERDESMISTNESFILNRLKAVEKSPEDIIKEAQDSFVPEPLQVTTVIPDVLESLSPPANKHSEPNPPRKTLFGMEINVTKNLLTGERTVLSTATVPLEELNQHAGLKVYDDSRKCVYALNSQEESHDQSCLSELSANEVEKLLRSATVHHQVNHQNYHQNHSRRQEHCFYDHQDERDRVEGCDLRNQGGHYGNHLLRNNIMEKDFSCRENWQRKPGVEHRYGHQESHYRRQEERKNHSNLSEGHRLGNHKGLGHHYGNHKDSHYSSYQVRNCHSVREDQPASHHANSIIRSNSRVNGGTVNGCTPLRLHDQEVSAYQPQLCYTPANYIPLNDYISVDEKLYCYTPTSYHSHDRNPPTALYSGPTHSDRVPSPLYGDDTPFTILKAMETTEPITAIFMGFQTAQDNSGQGQEFEGSMKAELVIIEDNEDNGDDSSMTEKKSHAQLGANSYPTGSSANGNMGRVEGDGDRRTERWVGPGIRKIRKKHKSCCTVC